MKSKTSLINRGILLNDFKRFAWIGVGYLLLLLFSTPLKIIMLYSQLKNNAAAAGAVLENGVAAVDVINGASVFLRILQFDTYAAWLQVMSIIFIPVLTGLLLFRYLQDSQASDMLHALPVKRETIYNTHVLAGIIFLFVPLLLTALATWGLAVGLHLKEITGAVILTWLGVSLLMNLLFFIVTAAVGMVTGMSSVQGALSFILLLLPSGLSILLLYNVSQFVYGFPYSYYLEQVTSISPLIRLTEVSNYPVGSVEAGVYLAGSIVIYFLGRYFYRQRPLESAGNAIVFDVLRPVFTYSVTFCFMLLVGGYFYSSQKSVGWTYFGYFIGSILAYFLAEILLNKSLQVFQVRKFKGYGVYCLAIVALIGLLQIDFAGYEKKLPAPEETKSVYFDSSFYALREKDNNMRTVVDPDNGLEYTYQLFVPGIFTEAEAITDIHSLHRQIIANRLEDKKDLLAKRSNGSFQDLQQICLAYELEDGKHLYREYTILVPKYASSLKPIYESPEYKEVHNEILRIDAADANMLEISARVSNKNLRIVDRTLIQQAISALQRDINEETYEEMTITNRSPSWANINITLDNKWIISLDWEKSYEHFDQWLKDTGQYDQARLVPADIKYVLLDKFTGEIGESVIYEEKPGVLKLTDPERLEVCLRNYTHGYTRGNEQAAYHVVFELKDGSIIYGFLFEEDAPGFIKEHFAG